jgi:hypothetical protein
MATMDDLQKQLSELKIQTTVQRDFIVWLLVRSVGSAPDPDDLLRVVSEGEDTRFDRLAPGDSEDTKMQVIEAFRREKDTIINAARELMGLRG